MNKDVNKKKIDGGEAAVFPSSTDQAARCAVVTIDGQYPQAGYIAVNENKSEIVFVHEGEITVKKNGEEVVLSTGDMIYLEQNVRYTLAGSATCFVVIVPGDAPTTTLVKNS